MTRLKEWFWNRRQPVVRDLYDPVVFVDHRGKRHTFRVWSISEGVGGIEIQLQLMDW